MFDSARYQDKAVKDYVSTDKLIERFTHSNLSAIKDESLLNLLDAVRKQLLRRGYKDV